MSSRQVFTFSRDGTLPFFSLFYNINPYTGTPVNAVCMCVSIARLLGLLSFAGSAAIGAFLTMSVFSPYLCYSTPIIARFFGGQSFTPRPFSLGKASGLVAFVATAFMILMMVVFLFPAAPGPVAGSMNYTDLVIWGDNHSCHSESVDQWPFLVHRPGCNCSRRFRKEIMYSMNNDIKFS
ncbi:hypothetical protein EDD18DRAFT_782988 [Armillaria luteobubalina]|uniref:Uncharacterized protein n=1 Tax=Armillaria luteobubalina TaxID=153913 RepID=A0AA39QEL8_9AGAR|nr:hypothetical protein EDD18DRAFT_782988 [Armillaria luteobubalina]